ncbi:MAG: helix-turn-helix domain-containing protein [Thermodesulfovibrionales bacterium]
MELIGETFKRNREDLGLDLHDIAGKLKIRHEYLRAIEDDAFEKMPPEVYTKGYIREYARFLGIDPEPIIKAYAEKSITLRDEINLHPPAARKSVLPRIVYAAIAAAVVLTAIILFTHLSSKMEIPLKGGKDINKPSAGPVNATAIPVNPQQQYLLKVAAGETTWLRIEMDGKSEDVLLKPGELREWTSKNGFSLKIGNAGGIRVMLNGKDMGTLGERGQVLKVRLPKEDSNQMRGNR